MKKTIIEGTVSIFLFFGVWLTLTQVDWLNIFRFQSITNQTERSLGNIFWEAFQKSEKENKNIYILHSVDSLVTKICKDNNILRESIKVHILDKDDINAFALPDGHLVIYSGLIVNSDNQEELTGVICHEIAHIQLNHVMKKLVKEIGLSVLVSMATGNGNTEVMKKAVKVLSSSAFDRSLEKEADIKAVDYMINAKLNPEAFANFLYKLSDKDNETTNYLTWISSHPNSKERAEYIIKYSQDKLVQYDQVLSNSTWNKLKEELSN